MSGSYYDFLALESRAYDIAHWIAMEARVAESLGRSVAPIESEGARRIVALASARPTPADVREPTDAQINVWSIIRSALSRAWAVADRPQVTSEVVARLDAIAADCEREVLTALRSEAPVGVLDKLRELICDVAASGVAFEDERLDYLEIQIDRQTWDEVCALAAARQQGGSDKSHD